MTARELAFYFGGVAVGVLIAGVLPRLLPQCQSGTVIFAAPRPGPRGDVVAGEFTAKTSGEMSAPAAAEEGPRGTG